MPAAAEHVQLRTADLLERDQRGVERVDPVLPPPEKQHALPQPVRPYMVERYEFEVDTTRAVAEWELEVAANLGSRPGGAAGA